MKKHAKPVIMNLLLEREIVAAIEFIAELNGLTISDVCNVLLAFGIYAHKKRLPPTTYAAGGQPHPVAPGTPAFSRRLQPKPKRSATTEAPNRRKPTR